MTVASSAPAVALSGHTRQPSRLKADITTSIQLPSNASTTAVKHRRFPSVVSPGLVFPPSLTSAPALSPSTAAIPHIPLSLARHQLSLITSDLSSHHHLQRQALDQLAHSYERWQTATLAHYEAVLDQVKQRANEHIHHLQQLTQQQPQPQLSAPSPSPNPHPPSPPLRPQSSGPPSAPPPPPSDSLPVPPAPTAADFAAADPPRRAVEALEAALLEVGLTSTSASPVPLPSLRSFHSSLSAWLVERGVLAGEVASIKGEQASLQAEKLRLTEWKGRIRGGEEGGSDWDAAKAALVQSGAELKARHAAYETRIAAYKEEEARLKAEWSQLTNANAVPLPSTDALQRLLDCREREEEEVKSPSEPSEAALQAPSAVEVGQSAGVEEVRAALAAAQAELEGQRAEVARLTRGLQTSAADPPPSSTAVPSPPSSSPSSPLCPSCPSSQLRIADLSAAIAASQGQLTAMAAELTSSQSRIAELERQLSLHAQPSPPPPTAAEVDLASQDLSRLLDEAIRRHGRELAELRISLQREGQEAVATLEAQQSKERRVWGEQVERMQSEAREAGGREGDLRGRLEGLEGQLADTRGELRESTVALQSLRVEAASALEVRASLQEDVASLTSKAASLTTQVGGLEGEVAALQSRLVEEVRRRKEFQMKFEDAKGKVRVYARVRPFSSKEVEAGEASLLRPGPNQFTIQLNEQQRDVLGNVTDKWRDFAFDHVFHAGLGGVKGNGSQADVWVETEPFAELSVAGINTCVFAYGQSGTGKTWTMSGQMPCEANGHSGELRGLKPRMIEKVFLLAAESAATHSVSVSCYLVEIYLNALEDLCWKADTAAAMRQSGQGKWPEAPELKVRVDGAKKKVHIDNVRVKAFTTAQTMLTYCEEAERFRRTRKTGLNEASSRSHLVFAMMIESTHRASGKTTRGKLSLVDLAGSERADKTNVEGLSQKAREAMLEEGVAINESLRMLKNVFRILGQQHLPVGKGKQAELVQYRGNMLTELMQDSLGGQAKTLMFVNVGPAASNISESLDSLGYGDLVKNITNEKVEADEDYLEQIRKLKEMVASYRSRLGEEVDV